MQWLLMLCRSLDAYILKLKGNQRGVCLLFLFLLFLATLGWGQGGVADGGPVVITH